MNNPRFAGHLWLLIVIGVLNIIAPELARCATKMNLEGKVQKLEERISEIEKKSGTEVEENKTFQLYWEDGIHFDTADKAFQLRLGGHIMNQWVFFSSQDGEVTDRIGDQEDGTEFRSVRIFIGGQIYERITFKANYEFARGDVMFKDVYMGLIKLPIVGNIRLGIFYEPFGLEEQTSRKFITFIERSLTDTFIPDRNSGLMLYNNALDKRLTWAAGYFRDTDEQGRDQSDEEFSLTTRMTGLPLYYDKGDKLIHLGAAYSRRFLDDSEPFTSNVRYQQRPETHLADYFVDTHNIQAENVDLFGGEAGAVFSFASIQGEFVHATVHGADFGTRPDFYAYYIMGSLVLTGEHRQYNQDKGVFSRIRPKENVFGKEGGGPGAWELAARFSHVDLDDVFAGVEGGELRDFTAGLNWYLNPNMRIMWNYTLADLLDSGDTDIIQMHFQVDF